MTKVDHKILLDEQTFRLLQSKAIVDFIQKFKDTAFETGKFNRAYQDLFLLQKALTEKLIINLEILFSPNEDYSITKMSNTVCKESGDSQIKEYRRKATGKYENLEINYLRKKYSAHLDQERESKSIQWDGIVELISIGQILHDKLSIYYNEKPTMWGYNDFGFNKIITDRRKNIEFNRLFRDEIIKDPKSEILNSLNKIINS